MSETKQDKSTYGIQKLEYICGNFQNYCSYFTGFIADPTGWTFRLINMLLVDLEVMHSNLITTYVNYAYR